MHNQVTHPGLWQVCLQRSPVISVIQRNKHARVSSGVQQAALLRVGTHHRHKVIVRQSSADRLPGFTSIVSAPGIRREVVLTMIVRGHIGRIRIQRGWIDRIDTRPDWQVLRRHVQPVRTAVARNSHEPVIGAYPHQRIAERRRRNIKNDAITTGLGIRHFDVAIAMLRALSLAGQIGADNLPMFTAIGAAPKLLGTDIERIGLERRHRERRYPGVAIFHRRLSLAIAANRPRRDSP